MAAADREMTDGDTMVPLNLSTSGREMPDRPRRIAPGLVIVVPAWHSCGSYEVFRAQVRAFKSLGYAVYVLAVPTSLRWSSYSKGYWAHYYEMTRDLGTSDRGHTAYGALPFAKPSFWRDAAAGARGSYVNWRTLPARLAPVPASLAAFARAHPVEFVLCNHYFSMPLAERVRRFATRGEMAPKLILETHDIQTNHYINEVRVHPLTLAVQDCEAMTNDEVAIIGRADGVVHLNEDERAFFQTRLPDLPHVLIYPPMPRRWNPSEVHAETDSDRKQRYDFLIVASANVGNYHNLCWFFDEVWSDSFASRFTLKIVGGVDWEFSSRNDPRFAKFRSSFIGRVEKLDWFYRHARAVLLPIIEGQGVSIKTIEAFSYGKPVIGMPLAFRGFGRMLESVPFSGVVTGARSFRAAISDAGEGIFPSFDWNGIMCYEKFFSNEVYIKQYFDFLQEMTGAKILESRMPGVAEQYGGAQSQIPMMAATL